MKKIIATLLILWPTLLFAQSVPQTPNLGLYLPQEGNQSAYLYYNYNSNIIDSKLPPYLPGNQVSLGIATPQQYGAKGGGIIDDYVAIQTALNSGMAVVYVPYVSGGYRLSNGIVIPPGVKLYSEAFLPSTPSLGTNLTFDLGVPTCVTMGGPSANSGSSSIKGIAILRATGAVPAGSIGLFVQNEYAPIVEDVKILSQSIGLNFKGGPAPNYGGITAFVNRVITGNISDAHEVIDSWPEVRHTQCRFGTNGAIDQNCNTYIRIQGGNASNSGGGVNTGVWDNCQFNMGNGAVATTWIQFANQTAGNIGSVSIWQFSDCHVEAVGYGITSDSSWPYIYNLHINGLTFYTPGSDSFFNLNAATGLGQCTISDSSIGAPMTIAPTLPAAINDLKIHDVTFNGAVSLTGNANSLCGFSNNFYTAGLTVAGTWNSLGGGHFNGGTIFSGGLTYSGANCTFNMGPFSWTPTITFGGGSTGITYGTNSGKYTINNNRVTTDYVVALTSKGSSTGTAMLVMTGLPTPSSGWGGIGGGLCSYYSGMASIIAPIWINVYAATGTAYIDSVTAGSAATVTNLHDTNFTNSSTLYGTLSYLLP